MGLIWSSPMQCSSVDSSRIHIWQQFNREPCSTQWNGHHASLYEDAAWFLLSLQETKDTELYVDGLIPALQNKLNYILLRCCFSWKYFCLVWILIMQSFSHICGIRFGKGKKLPRNWSLVQSSLLIYMYLFGIPCTCVLV